MVRRPKGASLPSPRRPRAAIRTPRRSDVRIGISGWNYPPWRGAFYPEGLVQRRELEYASRRFDSVEINGTFYSLQRPEYFQRWYDVTPGGFVFAVKGSRFITHMKKLNDVAIPLANFLASGVLCLREKLGPMLWQFAPNWALDLPRFEAFLELLPRSTGAAAKLARRHDSRMKGRAWTRVDADRPIRHAVEARHPSFFSAPFVRLLRRHHVALVFADTAETFPYAEDVTADFVYLRLHGTGPLYAGGYSDQHLEAWAKRIGAWTCGAEPADAKHIDDRPAPRASRRDAYVYFDNDAKVRAPFDAANLAGRVAALRGGEAVLPPPEGDHFGNIVSPRLTESEIAGRRAETARRWPSRAK